MKLGLRLFWVKMISGNHFNPSPHVWLQRKILFSGNSFLVDQYLLLWPGINFTLLFSVQIISGKREREREKREPRSEREREEEERAGAIVRRAIVRRARRNKTAIDKRRDRLTSALIGRSRPSSIEIGERARRSTSGAIVRRARSSIAPRVGRSHRSRLPSRQGPRDLIFSSAAPIFSSDLACTDLMNFFAGFCFFCEWLWNY